MLKLLKERGQSWVRLPLTIARWQVRSRLSGAQLAPGTLRPLRSDEMQDQFFMSKQAQRHGPVFKILWGNKMTTCIIGHERVRRFAMQTEGSARAVPPDLTSLFPMGFLRGIEGEAHKSYRRMLVEAFRATPVAPHEAAIASLITDRLAELTRQPQPVAGEPLRVALKKMTTALMLRLVLGVDEHSTLFPAFVAAFHWYAPIQPFIVVRDPQKAAYAELRRLIGLRIDELKAAPDPYPSLLRHLVGTGVLDETLIGNLVQMIESGRHDVHGLWHWIVKQLSVSPETVERLRQAPVAERRALARACVDETLRLEQIEVLDRVATSDIVFEGHFIPKASRLKLCIWEGHKDATKFSDPFTFRPDRFLGKSYSLDSYAPFGMDKHLCVGAGWTVDFSAIFVEEFARGFEWTVAADGKTVRDGFHFAPNPAFALNLSRRREAQAANLAG